MQKAQHKFSGGLFSSTIVSILLYSPTNSKESFKWFLEELTVRCTECKYIHRIIIWKIIYAGRSLLRKSYVITV